MKKRTKKILLIVASIIGILMISTFSYLNNSYEANPNALESFDSSTEVEVKENDQYYSFLPKENDSSEEIGLIFYQGGKVEPESYAPLMQKLAQEGISVYLAKMPFNLAVFDIDLAGDIIKNEDSIDYWYASGHSLGGAMIASFAENHLDQLEGLILLASYSPIDLTNSHLSTLTIYGSNDEVLNMDKYETNLSYLPKNEEVILQGGNHAQFGDYGPQKGDGQATISSCEQLNKTIEEIINFLTD